ncbi:6385_t:CDS:2, partial [Racocetra persica]
MLNQVENSINIQDLTIDILQDNNTSIDDYNKVLLDELLLEELSENIKNLNFSDLIQVEEYLDIFEENIVYEVFKKDQIISDFVETFREKPDEIKNEDSEEADNSVKKEIVNPNEALKSLENYYIYNRTIEQQS